MAAWPGLHNWARPSMQEGQVPQVGRKLITTWSPGARSVTPGPVSTTTAEASWPSTMGFWRSRSPLMTERSEWQRPAAAIFTSTSSRPGGSSSMVSMRSGRVSA